MTKTEYLAELEKELQSLPKKDFQEAMDYFTEYFEEAGPEKEADIIDELGSPREAAADIIENVLGKEATSKNKTNRLMPEKSRDKAILIGLGVLASPFLFALAMVALGLGIALVSILISAMIVLALIPFIGFIFALSAILIGFVTLGESIAVFSSSWPAFMMGLGGFLGAIGVGILLFVLSVYAGKLYLRLLSNLFKWIGQLWNNRKWRKHHEN